MARVFLTGASGYIGRRLAPRLLSRGHQVACLARSGHLPDVGGLELVEGQLESAERLSGTLANCEIVLHLAAATGKRSPAEYRKTNSAGTANLLRAAEHAGVPRFLFVSTIAAGYKRLHLYPYARSKRDAEEEVARSVVQWLIVRPTIVLGPLAPNLQGLARLARMPMMIVFGDGRTPVQPIFVDDLCDCLADLVGANDEALARTTIEIGGPEVLSVEQLMLRIRHASGNTGDAAVHLPLGAVSGVLRGLETVLRPLLPLTAGQLAAFAEPSTAAVSPWMRSRRSSLLPVDEILARVYS